MPMPKKRRLIDPPNLIKNKKKKFLKKAGLIGAGAALAGAATVGTIKHVRSPKKVPVEKYERVLKRNPNVPSKRVRGIAEVANRCKWNQKQLSLFNARLKMVNALAKKRGDPKQITAKDFMVTLAYKQKYKDIKALRDRAVAGRASSKRINQLNRVLDVMKFGEPFKGDALRHYHEFAPHSDPEVQRFIERPK